MPYIIRVCYNIITLLHQITRPGDISALINSCRSISASKVFSPHKCHESLAVKRTIS